MALIPWLFSPVENGKTGAAHLSSLSTWEGEDLFRLSLVVDARFEQHGVTILNRVGL